LFWVFKCVKMLVHVWRKLAINKWL
jgi:hypothetical protein